MLIVSHDRYFIDRLVDHTFVLEGDGSIKDFPGNYTEYRTWKSNQKDEPFPSLEKEIPKLSTKNKENTFLETSNKKHSYKTQRELDELELEIPKLEKQKQELELQLASGITDYNQIQELSDEAKRINELLDQKSTRWLEIQVEI